MQRPHTFAQANSHSSMLRSQLTCAEAASHAASPHLMGSVPCHLTCAEAASHAASASAWARRVRIEAPPSGRRLKVRSAYRA